MGEEREDSVLECTLLSKRLFHLISASCKTSDFFSSSHLYLVIYTYPSSLSDAHTGLRIIVLSFKPWKDWFLRFSEQYMV